MNPSNREQPKNCSPFSHNPQRTETTEFHQTAPTSATSHRSYLGQFPSPDCTHSGTQSNSPLPDQRLPHARQTYVGDAEPRPLPQLAGPSKFDVICARGSTAASHVGNLRFREIIRQNLPRYNAAKTKMDKSLIVTSIVDAVRYSSPNGGFIKQDKNGMWHDVGDAIAREKIGQTLRDQVSHEVVIGFAVFTGIQRN